jgi:hypothetical protein
LQRGEVFRDAVHVDGIVCIKVNVKEEIEYALWSDTADVANGHTLPLVFSREISLRFRDIERKSAAST